jgi:hypothetical protein
MALADDRASDLRDGRMWSCDGGLHDQSRDVGTFHRLADRGACTSVVRESACHIAILAASAGHVAGCQPPAADALSDGNAILQPCGAGAHTRPTPKGDEDRLIFTHPRLKPELRRWALRQDNRAAHDGEYRAIRANPDTDFVLVTRTGKQIPDTAIHKQLKRRAVEAGLYPLEPAHREHRSLVTPHALRRTFATILLNDGEHIDAVADVLGHESVDTTHKHYAFASEERRRATINAFKVGPTAQVRSWT